MTRDELVDRLRSSLKSEVPLPGCGRTACRHKFLFDLGRENLSLARLAEAHWDAVAILAEAGRSPRAGVIYGVWAAEKPGLALLIERRSGTHYLVGGKVFCSGAGIVDRALVTVPGPVHQLVDVDLRADEASVAFDASSWKTSAFAETVTATASFNRIRLDEDDFIGGDGWYLKRAGFWHGACGPAACWAGGAAGLYDYAGSQSRKDPHTLAHLGAMHADVWALLTILEGAGREIDEHPADGAAAHRRALVVRHLVEQASTDMLRRLARAYGPHPLALDEDISRRYQELDLYLRQCHAERDLHALGELVVQLNH